MEQIGKKEGTDIVSRSKSLTECFIEEYGIGAIMVLFVIVFMVISHIVRVVLGIFT